MSKGSNYNIVCFILNRKTDPIKFVKESVNTVLPIQYRINNIFSFGLGKKNQIERTAPSTEKSLLTFNISRYRRFQFNDRSVQTYKLFRKKDYNTLYEINTVSKIIRFQNSGQYDKDFIIDWSIFQDVILLSDKVQPNKLQIYKLFFNGIKEVTK